MLDNTQAVVAITVGGIAILGTLFAWLRWVAPQLKQWQWERRAKNDVLIGRPASLNRITGEHIPALPGVADKIETLAEAVHELVSGRIENHEERLQALEAAAVERVVTKAESAAAFRAMEAIARGPDEFTD